MSIFNIFTKKEVRANPENPKYSLDDPAILDAIGLGDGGSVSISQSMASSAVYGCIRILAESMSILPVQVFERVDAKTVNKVFDIPLQNILHNEPNGFQTSAVFREAAQSQCGLWGNHYSEIIRNTRTGEPIAIEPIDSWDVTPKLVERRGRLVKEYKINGDTATNEKIFHVPALGYDGISGLSPIALHRKSVGMSLSALDFGDSFYKNGTRLSGVLEHPQTLTEGVIERLKNAWATVYAGSKNSGKVAILEEGMKFNPLSMPLDDAQYIETRKFQVTDIARIFRVPPHMLADLDRATFSNIEQQSIEFVRYTMLPWVTKWEQEINRQLFTATQKGRYYVKFNLGALLRGDVQSRYNAYKTGRDGGWLSVNDILELEDRNPIENGDTYLEPMNMQPLGTGQNDESEDDNTRFYPLIKDAADRIVRRERERLKHKDPIEFYTNHFDYVKRSLEPIFKVMNRNDVDDVVKRYIDDAVSDIENIKSESFFENRSRVLFNL